MRNIVLLFIVLLVGCSYSTLGRHEDFKNTYQIVKIDSTKNMYLIQFQNGTLKELLLSERNCKKKLQNKNSFCFQMYDNFLKIKKSSKLC